MRIQTHKKFKAGAIWILLAALAATAGCGVKAPPVVPNQPTMPKVDNLSGVREDSTILLSWTHPTGHPAVAGYAVLQLKIDIFENKCPTCTRDFQEIETVMVPTGNQSGPVSLNSLQPLESGYNYTFIVQPFQASGARGPDSNPVVVETGGPS